MTRVIVLVNGSYLVAIYELRSMVVSVYLEDSV